MIGIMFGIWYLAIAIGNKIAGTMGGMIDEITAEYSMTTFFLIFTLIPIGIGIFIMLLSPFVKKLMHGIH
jgi:POT family proton-dependent oligopeptide transporter